MKQFFALPVPLIGISSGPIGGATVKNQSLPQDRCVELRVWGYDMGGGAVVVVFLLGNLIVRFVRILFFGTIPSLTRTERLFFLPI